MTSAESALRVLLDVCLRMDSEDQGRAPDELEYQEALANAKTALGIPLGTRSLPPVKLSPNALWPFPVDADTRS